MAPRNYRTITFSVIGSNKGLLPGDVVAKISKQFGEKNVESIQFCPGTAVRVSFNCASRKEAFDGQDELTIGEVSCRIMHHRKTSHVLVYHFPF